MQSSDRPTSPHDDKAHWLADESLTTSKEDQAFLNNVLSQTFDNKDVRATAAEDLKNLTGVELDDDQWGILRDSIIVQGDAKKWRVVFEDGMEGIVASWIDAPATMTTEHKERVAKPFYKERVAKAFLVTLRKPLVDST